MFIQLLPMAVTGGASAPLPEAGSLCGQQWLSDRVLSVAFWNVRVCADVCAARAAAGYRRQTSDTLAVSVALKPTPDMTHKLAKYLVPQGQVRGRRPGSNSHTCLHVQFCCQVATQEGLCRMHALSPVCLYINTQ